MKKLKTSALYWIICLGYIASYLAWLLFLLASIFSPNTRNILVASLLTAAFLVCIFYIRKNLRFHLSQIVWRIFRIGYLLCIANIFIGIWFAFQFDSVDKIWIDDPSKPSASFGEAIGEIIVTALAWGILYGLIILMIAQSIISYLILPTIISFPLLLIGSLIREKPKKILLLRPFAERKISRTLINVINNDLYKDGYIYTLSDISIKRRKYIKLLAFIGQYSFLFFRTKIISTEWDITATISIMNRNWLRQISWMMVKNKVFAIECTNEIWRNSVQRLALNSDQIIIDINQLTENVRWEIDYCFKKKLSNRLVFIVQRAKKSKSLEMLKDYNLNPKSIFVYDNEKTYPIRSVVTFQKRIKKNKVKEPK